MKLFKLLLLLTLISSTAIAQTFERGVELYNLEQYEEAAEHFSALDDHRSMLFAGKTYLALSELSLANRYLYSALGSSIESVQHEALYTLALTHFELKNYDQSLTYLHQLMESRNRTGLRNDARRFYNQILDYISANQRFQLLHKLQSHSIRYDLVARSQAFLDPESFQLMVTEFLKLTENRAETERIHEQFVANPTTRLRAVQSYPAAPIGTVYNIGVVLPEFDEGDPDFTIPRNLYFGMILAAEAFNERNIDQKVRLSYRNSYMDPDSTAKAFNELVWNHRVDAVIGPLFSEPATRMARLSEDFGIPMLAPLANSDDLNRDYNYTFQLNPTFEVHGRRMAQYAVQELGLDTLAVITEPQSLGRASALAFRSEAERLGAYISYFIEEDFASSGYDFSEVTEVFTPNAALRDSLNYIPSKAIYAPFTGQASATMMNLMLNDLEAMRSEVVILGSEELEFVQLTPFQHRFFDIYYTRSFGEPVDQTAAEFFREDFESRFGASPDQFSHLGFDAATYLFQSLETAGNPDYLERVLRNSGEYRGLSMQINFDGKRVNQHLFIRPLSERAQARMERRGLMD